MFKCLLPQQVEEIRKAMKSKDFNVVAFIKMSSEQRIKEFQKYAGDMAEDMNVLFEEKLVLKNKERGLKNFIEKVGQVGRYSPEKKAQLEQARAEWKSQQQERIFNPQEEKAFLKSLAEKILGTAITAEDAKKVWEMSKIREEKLKGFDNKNNKWESDKAQIEYGLADYAYKRLISEMKDERLPIKDAIASRVSELNQQWKEDKITTIADAINGTLNDVSNTMVSSLASWDASFLGRQGIKTLLTNPKIWLEGVTQSKNAFQNTFSKEDGDAMFWASVYSSENYMNGEYEKANILPKTEEEIPTSNLERIPIAGKIYKASDSAFRNTATVMRTKLYDFYSNLARKNGVEMTDTQIKDIGKLVNSLTARGDLGKSGSGLVKVILWAPKMIKSNWDTLTAHTFGAELKTGFARKEAAKNSLRIIAELAIILSIAKAFWPDSVEEDPRSSDFGKIKMGNTRFDITGGMGSLVTLASRLAKQSSKSSTTGIVTKFGTGYGQRTGWDVLLDFLENKTAPYPRFLIDMMKGETFEGDKPLSVESIAKRFTPISLQNLFELKDDASADKVLGVLTDFLGIGASSYEKSSIDWNKSESKEMTAFKKRAGQKMFDKANEEFNKKMSDKITELQKNPRYQKLTNEEKQKVINKHRDKIKKQVLRRYRFNYTSE